MSHGQGRWTARKEDGFAAAFATSLSISRGHNGRLLDYPFWYADINPGPGENERVGCRGSPLIFMDVAAVAGRKVNAFFCDNDPDFVARLKARLEDYPIPDFLTPVIVCEDNALFLERFAGMISARENPSFAVGAVLCDPNGFRHGFPLDGLVSFAERFPRIDIILNFPIGLFQRVRGCLGSSNEAIRKGFLDWPTLPEILDRFDRSDKLIRNPPPRGGNGGGEVQTTLIFRNIRGGASIPRQFYRTDSTVGRQIIDTLAHVQTEQPSLFDEVDDDA